MRTLLVLVLALITGISSFSQVKPAPRSPETINRPKLVVGIVVDQMRWDYLYRYYDRYASDGGFKRMLNQGFSCENTLIPYTPTITACGHTCIYTGSVPAIHGITGNNWWDNELGKNIYCSEDKTVKTVGTTGTAGEMSPRNMLVTSICDELKLATNFRSKVVGVAIKDRGAILPAGHAANAAYWYDAVSGKFISSTFYMEDLPQWVKDFNAKKLPNKYYEQGWNTLYPVSSYVQSTADEKKYEGKSFGADQKGFPYDLKKFVDKNFGAIASTPYGNTLTAEMSKAAIEAEQLGADNITDFLAISFSSPDYIGHSFGPNSIEAEDGFYRLDKELGDLFRYLDKKVGVNQYLVFLSADHGVSHVPGFLKENRLPGDTLDDRRWNQEVTRGLKEKFGVDKLILSQANYQLYLNHPLMDSLKVDQQAVKQWLIDYYSKQVGIARVFALDKLSETTLNSKVKEMISNGYYPRRSGDIQLVLQPGYIDGGATGTTHGSWNPYDAHIPLLWYGWHVKPGKTNRETYMSDIAPTIAGMLHIQMPNGNVGHVIEEVSK
jgi:predicted AlkP superfamily pyrophosphatase or phosphodiesterase